MKLWDSSAIVPLVCRERVSPLCRSWLRNDPVVLVWALTATEVISALARKRREGVLTARRFNVAKQRLAGLERAWHEVTQYDAVRARARRLLETHSLRAADALHLGAALVAAEERTHVLDIVTFDGRLAASAEREGLRVHSA